MLSESRVLVSKKRDNRTFVRIVNLVKPKSSCAQWSIMNSIDWNQGKAGTFPGPFYDKVRAMFLESPLHYKYYNRNRALTLKSNYKRGRFYFYWNSHLHVHAYLCWLTILLFITHIFMNIRQQTSHVSVISTLVWITYLFSDWGDERNDGLAGLEGTSGCGGGSNSSLYDHISKT